MSPNEECRHRQDRVEAERFHGSDPADHPPTIVIVRVEEGHKRVTVAYELAFTGIEDPPDVYHKSLSFVRQRATELAKQYGARVIDHPNL